MTATSKFSLILIHDDGETHRLRMRKGVSRMLIVLMVLSPLLGILGIWAGWEAWRTMTFWRQEKVSYQTQIDTLRVQLERMTTLNELLQPQISAQLSAQTSAQSSNAVSGAPSGRPATSDVPTPQAPEQGTVDPSQSFRSDSAADADTALPPAAGREESPDKSRTALNTGVIRVENMQARLLERRRLRASVDLYSVDSDGKQITGRTTFSLITADGQLYPLINEDAPFRISRFKKVVTTSSVPVDSSDVEDASVMVEVFVDDKLAYRNIFPVESR